MIFQLGQDQNYDWKYWFMKPDRNGYFFVVNLKKQIRINYKKISTLLKNLIWWIFIIIVKNQYNMTNITYRRYLNIDYRKKNSLLIVGILSALVEVSIFKLSGANLVFCALLTQMIAYRWAHFGYAPTRSYMLFGTIFLNVFLVFALDKLLMLWYRSPQRSNIPRINKWLDLISSKNWFI